MTFENIFGRRVQNMPERLRCKFHPTAPVVIGQGKGPHAASTRCGECDRFTGWVSKAVAESLNTTLGLLD